MRNAIRHAFRGAMHSGMAGGEPDIIPLMHALSPLAGEISTALLRGQGSATFTRSTIAYHRQPNNVQVLVQANEARIQGARRVENFATNSDDITQDWNTAATATLDDFETASFPAVSDSVYHEPISSSIAGEVYSLRLKLSGSGNITIAIQDGVLETAAIITLSSGGGVYSVNHTGGSSSTFLRVRVTRASGQATTVTINNVQVENLSGASNTAPSEYIPTTTAAVAKYFTTTNANTVTSNVVAEIAGLPLHPTVRKKGANCLARYAVWEALTAYSVGDRIIPTSGSGTAGGNGFYYECDGSGTSGASEPTWPTTIGNSEGDGSTGWENTGHYKLAGYLGEPAAENLALWNRDFTNTAWVKTNITALKDATGIDGVANSASTLTADAGNGTAFQTVTVASAAFNSAFFVKRKAGTGTIEITDNNGTNYTDITASLSTGEYLRFDINRTQANPVFGFRIVTSGDEIEVDVAHLATGTVPSSPIVTTTAPVTRSADDLSYSASGNLEDAAGALFCSVRADDWDNETSGDMVVGSQDAARRLMQFNTAPRMQAFDGTNAQIGNTDSNLANSNNILCFTRWSGSVGQAGSSGSSGAEGAYDGSWGIITLNILNRDATAQYIQGTISDIRIYKKDLGQTVCESLTSAD